MAQREVIASLDLDEKPAVDASARMRQSFTVLEGGAARAAGTIEHEFNRAGPAFIHHMFSMRAAATAFLGGFSLAGIISQIASLMKGIIEADPAFENLTKSAALLKGELLGIGESRGVVSAALQEITTWMDRVSASIETIKGLGLGLPDVGGENIGLVGRLLFGTGTAWVNVTLEQVGKLLDRLQAMSSIRANRAVGGASLLEEWQKNLKEADLESAMLEKGPNVGTLERGFGLTLQGQIVDLTDWSKAIRGAGTDMRGFEMTYDQLQTSLKEGLSGWNDKPIKEWSKAAGEGFDTVVKKIQFSAGDTQVAVEAMANAMTASLSQWAQGGSFVIGKFFSQMLVGVGQSLLAYGALAIIKAWVEDRPEGYAAGWGAIAAGVAALAAARLVGGGAQAGSTGSSRGAAGSGAGGGQGGGGQTQTINVIFEGDNIGTEDFYRRVVLGIQRAVRDGAGGGNL